MPNERVAEQIYEKHGEVGFWYFYKDAIVSHSKTLKDTATDGPEAIAQGILMFFLGIVMTIGWVVGPFIFVLSKIPKARKASKHYKEWLENQD